MVTILLAFFIILQRLAQERQAGFEASGIGPFKSTFNSTGLPGMLSGWRNALKLRATGAKYVPDAEEPKPNEDQNIAERLINPADPDLENALQTLLKAPEDVVLPMIVTIKDGRLTPDCQRRLRRSASLLRECRNRIDVRCTVPPDVRPFEEGDSAWETAMRHAMILAEHFCFREGISVDRVQVLGCISDAAGRHAARKGDERPTGPAFAVILRPGTLPVVHRRPDTGEAKFRYEVRPMRGN